MNCNPFTNGHKYLVELASSKVDYLYIFVVEEDLSVFPFKDRIQLVQKGTMHLRNVKVLPSGKYIISAITFPEYFSKDANKNVVIDPSLDVELFAKFIAPALDIKVRFLGEEPIDETTRMYNSALLNVLPKHGISVEVIPRKIFNNEPISASIVRKLLEQGDFDSIKNIVPESTYSYLIEFHKNNMGTDINFKRGGLKNG